MNEIIWSEEAHGSQRSSDLWSAANISVLNCGTMHLIKCYQKEQQSEKAETQLSGDRTKSMMNHNPLIKSPADSPSQHTQDDAPLAKGQDS